MSHGPGKYDHECSVARALANADGVLLIVLNGDRGHGFSVQIPPTALHAIPAILRDIANQIEADI